MILCVTGPMAAGKNAASSILEKKGFACVDADLLVHQAVENAKEEILASFGSLADEKGLPLLTENGHINRRNLGALIFQSPELIKKQEDIVYPILNGLFEDFMEENKGRNLVINATVLYKVPLIKKVDSVLFIDAPLLQRLFRAKKRDGMSLKLILQRFKAQRNLFAKYKKSVADTVRVGNTGSMKKLEWKIDKFLTERR
jgi:dephospho-CoA kinase